MKNLTGLAAALVVAASLSGCGSSDSGPDLGRVLDRTQQALKVFQNYLTKENAKELTEAHKQQLAAFMGNAMNIQPPVHTTPVGIKLLKDSTFEGFDDPNKNNFQDSGESRLFKVEIDFEGKRLIATSEGGRSTGMGLGTGLLAGMLMGRLLGGQRAAGVKPGAFANRKVESRSAYRASRARSSARSGGRFGGK